MVTPATSSQFDYDVAIAGGGPGGSTLGTLLKKYNPALKVLILEREVFPRDHIGESQLPPISRILHEMGVWDKVERAGFPVKLGATYTWGKTTEPWAFSFIPKEQIGDETRPGKYEGWRTRVAFQVDRAIYDDILLRHAAELGCEVRQGTKVTEVLHEQTRAGQKINGLTLESGQTIRARYYVDCSGNAAVIRRRLGIEVDAPTLLRNVAFWDYFSRPGMNQSLLEGKVIRILIRSIGYGWLWYIVLSDDRTSVGLVCNAEYFKNSGKRPEEIFRESLALQPQIASLIDGSQSRGTVESTTDWSYVAQKVQGPNWFLCGECLGFADPILSAGLTLTHTCAEHLACTILELDRGEIEATWLRSQYESIQKRRVLQHIKFAEYWYSSNGLFSNIVDNCVEIAKQSGFNLNPADAFRWLSNGGVDDVLGQFAIGGLGLTGIKSIQKRFQHERGGEVEFQIDGATALKLNLRGAANSVLAQPQHGRILKVPVYERGTARLPMIGPYGVVVECLKKAEKADALVAALKARIAGLASNQSEAIAIFNQCIQCLEALAAQGWIYCEKKKGEHALRLEAVEEGEIIYTERLGPKSSRKQ